MEAMKSYKYRLYPNKEQVKKLQWTLDRCRELYNAALQERRDAYNVSRIDTVPVKVIEGIALVNEMDHSQTGKSVSKFEQSRSLTEIKHDIRPEYQGINDHVLRYVLEKLDKAFDAFFRRVKAGETPGYPRFQGYGRYNSLTTDSGFKLKEGNLKKGSKLYLQNIGDIKMKLHRPIKGKIKTITVKREGDQWYVSCACEIDDPEKLPVSYEDVGIDLGVMRLATLSNGETVEHPRLYRQAREKLAKKQKKLSAIREKMNHRGSKTKPNKRHRQNRARNKARRVVARLHRKVRNQRQDTMHKASRALVNRYQVIAFEDIQTANLTRRPKPKQDEATGHYLPNGAAAKGGLNQSILDAGWGMFVSMTQVKAAWAGRCVVLIDPQYTSQACSGCGKIVKKALSERTHLCTNCGLVLDRDENAAINILNLGMKQIEAQRDGISTHDASQTHHKARVAPSEGEKPPPPRNRRKSSSRRSPPSQGTLWDSL